MAHAFGAVSSGARSKHVPIKLVSRVAFCVLALASMGWFGGFQPEHAIASCAVSRPLGQALKAAPVIFIGKVITTTNQGRRASVHVLDIWRGGHIPRRVTVWGSPSYGQEATSVDRTYRRGAVYLFIPSATRTSPPYDDNACSSTRLYTARIARFRPPDAHRPV